MYAHNIIVIGASAGGIEALKEVVRGLPADLPATVFVVLHISPDKKSILPQILTKAGPLPAKHPDDHEEIKQGQIYVARPNHHIVILDGHVGSALGPRESRHRPAADTLFRTAAEIYGSESLAWCSRARLMTGPQGSRRSRKKAALR